MRRFGIVSLVLGLFLAAACGRGRSSYPQAPVVLISIDTLRADHLPVYGYAAVQTPAIDALARGGVLFENAYSHCPLTLPSHVSMLTGLLPSGHGVHDNTGYRLDAAAHMTLPALLRRHGYSAGAAVSAFVLRGSAGLSDSFDFYDDAIAAPARTEAISQVQRAGSETVARAERWIDAQKGKPFFLFLHLYEPHTPYEPPEPFRSRFRLPYDGEIATADDLVGGFLGHLRSLGRYDRSIVILTSDHGEGLGDHGEAEHGILLYRESLHVPLIVKLPDGKEAGTRVAAPVGLVDLFPTVAQLVGVSAPPGLAGTSLFSPDRGRSILSETFYPRIHLGWSDLHSVTTARFHLIDGPRPELYDDLADSAERSDLASKDDSTLRVLKRELLHEESGFAQPSTASAEEARKLASLGYLSGRSAPAAGPLPNPRDRIGVLKKIEAAFDFVRKGKDAEAAAALHLILDEEPGIFDVEYEYAETLGRLKRFSEAAQAYRQARELSPSFGEEVALALARVDLELGKLDEARTEAQRAEAGNRSASIEVLARIALAQNDLAETVRQARQISGDPAAEANAAVLLAEVSLRNDRPSEALATLDRATESAGRAGLPSVANLQFLRGDALGRLKRNEEAQDAFRAEIRDFPENSSAYARLAIVEALEGRTVNEVHRTLNAMVRANPSPQTRELAARTLETLGDRRGAALWRRGIAPSSRRPGS